MIYKKKDFANCQFNPLADQPILTEYPKFNEIILPEWVDEPQLDNIIRYVIMVYDPKSILVYNERDLNYRKGIAAELASFDLADEEFMATIYNSSHAFIAELILKFLMRFAKSKEWAALCAFEFAFWESIQMILEPISGKNNKEELDAVQKKATIKDELDKDIRRLESYFKAFCGEDNDLLDKARKRITPEMIADRK